MNNLYPILQNYYPEGEAINLHLAGIVNEHLEEVLVDLPRIDSLPPPDRLSDVRMINRTCPLVVEETITIAALRRHLGEATPDTPEIGITVFGNGTQVLEVGTTESVLSDSAWKAFQERGIIDFHTHPDPTEAAYMRNPSMDDITHAIILEQSTTIGSHDGLTHLPKPEVSIADHTGFALWRDYVACRGFNESRFAAYGARRVYDEFIRDVIRTRFSTWDTLDEKASLADTILLQREP